MANYTEKLKDGTVFDLIFVDGGAFEMGDAKLKEFPHSVELSPFFMAKFPVTQALYAAIMKKNPSHFKGENRPVERISWEETQEFILKLNEETQKTYRLPTEAEWEFAAKGGNFSENYLFSGSDKLKEVGWFEENSGSETHDVGQKYPNELGLFDMSGNVWEWCGDWYDENYYKNSPQKDPKGANSGSPRVVRGGSWGDSPLCCRSAYRGNFAPSNRGYTLGFRLARSF
jgi:formylglycine-generating enzyme required for sulfatase activity